VRGVIIASMVPGGKSTHHIGSQVKKEVLEPKQKENG
jgi:hypothetical protein